MEKKMNKCQHADCQFIGVHSLIGEYVCCDCGFKIEPLVFHFVNGYPHVHLNQIGPFTDHKEQKSILDHCLKKYWESWEKACYQGPHFDHEPTQQELEQEDKWELEASNYWWLKDQYSNLITFLLKGN